MQRITVGPDVANAETQQSGITLDEVARARPPRGYGAPSRCQSHKERIRARLSSELYDSPELYGRSPRNRISELRKPDGCLIETVSAGASVVRYVLIRDGDGTPPQQLGSPTGLALSKPPEQFALSDYMRRIRKE